MESQEEVDALVARWERLPGFSLRNALVLGGEGPFGRTERGQSDFRGVSIEGAVHKVEIVDADFAHSRMGASGQLGGRVHAVRCRFDACSYESNINGRFESCSFLSSKLADSTIREVFDSCDFSAADLSRARGRQIRFKGCSFSRTILRKACFYDSEFIECRLENVALGHGSLAGTRFADCEFVGVDWNDTILDRVSGVSDGRR